MTNEPSTSSSKPPLDFSLIIVRLSICVVLLVLGIVGMVALANSRKKPAETLPEEPVAQVQGFPVELQDFQTTLRGFGTTQPFQKTRLTPEVTGKIIFMHPQLQEGNVIPKGEILFQIDPTDYRIALLQAEASLQNAEAMERQTILQNESNSILLESTKRSAQLAKNQFERMKELFQQNNAESESALESSEQAYIREELSLTQIENSVAFSESNISSARANMQTAAAQLQKAKADLERTTVKAPYNSRIVTKIIEREQLVTPGSIALEIADDSILEVVVSMDSAEVAEWLNVERDPIKPQWFAPFQNYPVTVAWSHDPMRFRYHGQLHRVRQFNSQNRTFELVVQIRHDKQTSESAKHFPLTDGMFCRVEIPGRPIKNVYAIPRTAVDSQNIVYVSNENKLQTRIVEVARVEQDVVLISSGLENGDIVITRRPPLPVEGMALKVNLQPNPLHKSGSPESSIETFTTKETTANSSVNYP
jgi:multidrug efflux system membrane fusion protein